MPECHCIRLLVKVETKVALLTDGHFSGVYESGFVRTPSLEASCWTDAYLHCRVISLQLRSQEYAQKFHSRIRRKNLAHAGGWLLHRTSWCPR